MAYLKWRSMGPRPGLRGVTAAPVVTVVRPRQFAQSRYEGNANGNGDNDTQVEHEARSRPGSCAGYRPACRRAHARATDHARADPAPDGRVDRGHLSAGAQV